MKAALSESEYEAARSSTLTAFYTPATVIHPIYRALERFGVKGGKILEPSMGTGAFLAHGHFGSSDAKFYGIELDSITGRISKQLYQKANIQVTGYENALLPDNYFDCVMGNVPFGNFQVNDPQYNRLHFPIHDYFFAKSMPAFADDPLTTINNLSDFVFSAIKAIGAILLGFGIVQIGLALKGHDASQRAQGFMTFFGGVVIYFAKDILDMIL